MHINLTLLLCADIKLGEERTQVCLIAVTPIHSHGGFLSVSLFGTRRIDPLNYLIDVVNF